MKIIPLSEGCFTIDQTKVFVPFDPAKDDLQSRSRGSLLVEIQPFLVVTEQDVILLDAGLGLTVQGVLQIYENLALHGFSPTDITKVLVSHLHRDHAGGLTFKADHDGGYYLSFPQARYYISHDEMQSALRGGASYATEGLQFLEGHEQVVLLGEEGTIEGNITYARSGGHSPFHQVFWIVEKELTCFFGGDEAPQLKQLKTKFIAKYDHDGRKAMEWRKQWWEEGEKSGWTFLFYHDITTPTYSSSKYPI